MSFNNYLSTRVNGDFELYDLSLNFFPFVTISSNLYDVSNNLITKYTTISSVVPLYKPFRFFLNGVNNTYNISNMNYLYSSVATLSGLITQSAKNYITKKYNGDFELYDIYDLSLNVYSYKTISSNLYDVSNNLIIRYTTISSVAPYFNPFR